MKKYLLVILTVFLLCTLIGCKSSQLDAVITLPTATEPTTEGPTVTQNPFEGESEIDFSDIVTAGPTEPDITEVTEGPEQTEGPKPTEPTKPQVKPTEPVVTEPAPEETEAPEETQTPTTASPYGPDGYNNQIVRP